jgi:PAS domain S-box-containing protein
MEENLRESEERFRNLFESIQDPVGVYVGREGRLIAHNKAFNEMSGYTDEELKGKPFLDFVHPDDHALVLERYRTEYSEEELPLVYEIRAVNKTGKIIPLEISVSTYKVKGKVIGIEIIHRDITERKRAEEELVRLSSAVKTSTDSIVISDLDAKIIDVNEATLKMYGTDDKRDLIGKNSFDLIAPEEREKALAGMEDLLEKGYLKGREYHIATKDGSKIPVDMSVSIMKDADGKPIGFVGITRDITERKKMEDALKRQRDIAITLSGAGTLTEMINRLFDDLLEIEEFDCAGFYLFDKKTGILDMIAHRGLPDKFVEKVSHFDADSPYTKVVLNGKPIYQKTSDFPPLLREDIQSSGIRSVAAIPIKYGGEVIGHLNMASHTRDEISASTRHTLESVGAQIGETIVRVRMEEKLRESEEKLIQYSEHLEELVQKRTTELLESEKRYSVLVEEASDGVVIIQDGKIFFTNKKAALEIVGYPRDELVGLPFAKIVYPKYLPLVNERYERRLRGEKIPSTYEIELIAKTGNQIPVELSATRIHYQGHPADLIIVRDIRERKQMEKTRLKLEKLAAIGELATMVGHDLRNPLQSIENAAYYLNNELTNLSTLAQLSPKTTEMLQIINDSINYADKIIRDLQDFSATKAPVLKETDINTLVTETLSQVHTPETVQLHTEQAQLPQIKVDKDQIKRVFLNLTTNAIQAMENGGTLTISTKKTNGFVEVSFKDTGVGIPKENMEKLFIPFFTTRAKGMGMGLPICKKFVEGHGGRIEVESQVSKGTTFTVRLPILKDNGGEKT